MNPQIKASINSVPAQAFPPDRRFVYDDGGRSIAGFKGVTGDCTVRAIVSNNRLRLTGALAAELDLWLEEILSRGSLASQQKTLSELLRLLET